MSRWAAAGLRWRSWLAASVLLVLSAPAWADCNASNPGVRALAAPTNVPLPAIGQTVSTSNGTSFTFSGCSKGIRIHLTMSAGSTDAATLAHYNTYSANVFGVRVRVNGVLRPLGTTDIMSAPSSGTYSVAFEVIRRNGTTVTHDNRAPNISVWICEVNSYSGCPSVDASTFRTDFTFGMLPGFCRLANHAPPLADVRATDLGAVNSTVSANAGFIMPLTCTGAVTMTTNVRFTLRDAHTTGSTSNLLAAIPGSTTSKGLQLQLLRKNASGTYVVQNMGSSWTQAKTAANVTAPLDFAVRYIRTGALTPGTIGSAVTLTMDYP